MQTTMSKSQFKPRVLAILRQVEESGDEVILTDHGRPVVKIVSLGRGGDLDGVQHRWRQRVADGTVRYDADEAVKPLPPEAWGELA